MTKEVRTVWTCDVTGKEVESDELPEEWRQFGTLHVSPEGMSDFEGTLTEESKERIKKRERRK